VLALEMFMKPAALSTVSATPMRRLLWWLVPPLAVILGFFAIQWGRKEYKAQAEAKIAQAEEKALMECEKAEAAAAQAQKDHDHYSLEVYGLGFSLDDDRFTQKTVWNVLQQGDPHSPVLPADPKDYPWSEEEKGEAGALPAYETALKEFPEKWEIPFFLGGPALHKPDHANYLKAGLAGARTAGGMHYHRFRTVVQVYEDRPDQLPAEVFSLFDQYPDLPATAIAVEDSLAMRDTLRSPGTPPLIKNGYEVPALTGSGAVILLGRRDRVDMLRPTATDASIKDIHVPFETDQEGLEYIRASRKAAGEPPPTDYVVSYDDAPPEPQQPDRQNHLRPFWEAQGGAPLAFKPSRFVKRPWCQEQLVQFDLLKVLARLHRPQTAQYVKDGKTLGSREQERAFLDAWEKALATLPEGEKPVRVIYDFGPKGATRLAPLTIAIRTAGPDLDLTGKDGIDLTARLRNTGANSFYVGIALGILATERQGGVSAVVNLRRDDRATVIMVSPPTEQDNVRRKIHFHSDYLGAIDQE
jgi:hypothetical protein